jgi:uncharacterized phiE125 gp8 family phage protein
LISEDASPVTLAESKSFLRVDTDFDDTLITNLIDSCTRWGETFVSKSFRTQFYACSDVVSKNGVCVNLPKSSVSSVDEVSYSDSEGNLVIVDPSEYTLVRSKQISHITVSSSETSESYNVTLQCDPPVEQLAVMRQGILHHVSYLYENRGDTVAVGKLDAPLETINLYNSIKTIRI